MTNPTARAISLPSEADLLALLPSDLGDLTVLEHLQRMAEDAARYRWLRERDRLRRVVVLDLGFGFSSERSNPMSAERYLDEVLDECRDACSDAWGAEL